MYLTPTVVIHVLLSGLSTATQHHADLVCLAALHTSTYTALIHNTVRLSQYDWQLALGGWSSCQ